MILDTNVVSAMADGDRDLHQIMIEAAQVALPVIVLGEFRFGITSSRKRAYYQQWLDEFVPRCRVLAVDQETASNYASIRDELKIKGRPIPSNDAWIAALARQHNVPILSRDRHFDAVSGLRRVSW